MAPASSFTPTRNRVCVMDAAGPLGAALVARLLHRGYTVHAALQCHGKEGEIEEYMKGLKGEERERVKIFELDIFEYQSILLALKGCSALFYNFQPPSYHLSYDEQMKEVEVRAAHNVIEACAQTDSLYKVVFTSSITAVIWSQARDSMPSSFDERHWSDIAFCCQWKLWHAISKTLAERTAWALAMDRGICMVSVNAGLVVGPGISINDPYLKGAAEMYDDGVLVTVDLEYLVESHVSVFEDSSAFGRYLCFNAVVNQPLLALSLSKLLDPSTSPDDLRSEEGRVKMVEQRISNKKLNQLILDFQSQSPENPLAI